MLRQSSPPIPPSHTLYVKNLNDQISLYDLKANLFELFVSHGEILDIIAQKTKEKRGQAFVVFREMTAATSAMRSLQGFDFCGKQINIAYAKSESDAVAQMKGTFKPRDRKQK
uniref:RRM domain-containing protein n=1 Tax=Chromera velia CCMP2878 TaxID=1169474 RepID=A0A0G4HBU6_9ALVE|mmetsp:Transcript_6316/g.12510  ORF Transcript_6316/g.12510 Transcript_6316/m.12510 type:complete len:113 (+) Transcript_6316:449-787(+)|eukprot:Cvel_26064.t1-p1 / transcript=Cvel_26064.t1 / gene=Cvel_26064 / organism=Chromera_velia_CCMP2878 / gene_product=U1 small nuclear ribonucleoprotein A, putative / transcript_product=U1 small nuclear ribonucleoprotein A, putative / location=Cvel_scaffold3040:15634-15969(+) / protein_length=112 / sequence_SO=supercontig / SO=protein_coding / is_pseudo=false